MHIKTIVKEIAKNFQYKADMFKFLDWWFILREWDGKLVGDCEDFSLTAIWRLCNRNVLAFLWKVVITHQYRIYFCMTAKGERHAVGYAQDLWFDNWTLEALPKEEFLQKTGHKIKFFIPGPLIIINMILGALVRNVKRT